MSDAVRPAPPSRGLVRAPLAWLPLAALLAAPLALAACGEPEEPTYEAGVTDESGGELIVRDADEPGVPVDLPDTPMTPVAPGSSPGASPAPAATPE